MAITVQEIEEVSFSTAKRGGYSPQEVDDFLERLANEVDTYEKALSTAKEKLDTANQKTAEAVSNLKKAESEAKAKVEEAEKKASEAERRAQDAASQRQQSTRLAAPNTPQINERQISEAFIAAQRAADDLKEKTRQECEKTYREAEAKARDTVKDAKAQKVAIEKEVERLRKSCENFRTEYLSLLQHFSAEAERKASSLDAFLHQNNLSDNSNSATVANKDKPIDQRSQAATGLTAAIQAVTEKNEQKVDAKGGAASKENQALAIDEDFDIEEID
ncbi:MAG: DivIVA domain-containing protein [Coriobacteriales bacterium]|jgi:cell division initiation protein|nr:DivIVA domain-containing protein [Coriobacteriales bacterium]